MCNRYSKLFSGGGKTTWFNDKWSWYDLMVNLVGFKDLDKIYKMSAIEVLNHLSYLKDKEEFEKEKKK